MATKSIIKNVDIKEKRQGKILVRALEKAEGKKVQEVTLSRMYEDVKGDKIRRILGK